MRGSADRNGSICRAHGWLTVWHTPLKDTRIVRRPTAAVSSSAVQEEPQEKDAAVSTAMMVFVRMRMRMSLERGDQAEGPVTPDRKAGIAGYDARDYRETDALYPPWPQRGRRGYGGQERWLPRG